MSGGRYRYQDNNLYSLFMTASSQDGEAERLAALLAYGVLDTPPEAGFEHITSVVTRLFKVPIAAVTLVDADRQWFKSIRGWEVRETPREISFCEHAMWGDDVMVVPDATLDPRFAENPFVTGEANVRFYAGAPLHTPEGQPLGALCLIDRRRRRFSLAERQMLVEMASLVEDELLLRRVAKELHAETLRRQQAETTLSEQRPLVKFPSPRAGKPKAGNDQKAPAINLPFVRRETANTNVSTQVGRFQHIVEAASDAIFIYDLQGRFVEVNTAACKLVGYERDKLLRLRVSDIEISFDPVRGLKRWQEMVAGEAVTLEGFAHHQSGSPFPTETRISMVETDGERFWVALVRDTTGRKQAERLSQVRARQQRNVAQLGVRALQGKKVEALLDEAVAVIGEALDIEICRVLEHVQERKEFVTRAGLNLPDHERGQRAASDSPKFAAGHVVRTGEPVIIEDARRDARFQLTPWLRASGAVSGLHVSVGGDGSHSPQYGVLAAYTREQREFTEDDVSFVQSIANVLAAAITRQRAEETLRAVEARYERIAAHTPGVVYQYLLRPDGSLAVPFISESCRTMYGREPREIQDRPQLMMECVHPDDQPGFAEAIYHAKQTLSPLHWQGRHILPSGEIRWVRFDSRPERMPDGGVICDGIIVDVTDEEERKEALRQSEQRFRLANFHSPYPVMLHTDDGEVIQVNDAWTHITGYTQEEIPTVEAWLRLAYPAQEAKEEIRRFIAKAWDQVGVAHTPGRRIRCAGGDERIWDISGVNLGRLPDGRWLRMGTAVDVTERHQQEEALRLAKEEAERANLAKSVFLSRMSHELRTPLNAILGFGQLLEMSRLDEQDAQGLQHILKGGRHLLGMVDEVLDLARVEAGELGLKLSAVRLDKLLPECAGLMARTAQARGITCNVTVTPASRVPVRADEQRLRQVLLNLLSNAMKYNQEGGHVSLGCQHTREGRMRLNIRDTGPGITPEGLKRLFVPFERLGQELGEVEGTGLGLVVSKHLIEAMGGSLQAKSRMGKGSTFWVELPIATDAIEPARVAAGLIPEPKTAPAEHFPATILYVEDNVSNVQVVKTVIERLRPHWRFLSARDGQSGLQQAREHLPDAILLDLQLPGINGDLVLAEVRNDQNTHQIPVLLLSADATSHSRERLLALGANDYLSKPFNVAHLLERLDALLLTKGS